MAKLLNIYKSITFDDFSEKELYALNVLNTLFLEKLNNICYEYDDFVVYKQIIEYMLKNFDKLKLEISKCCDDDDALHINMTPFKTALLNVVTEKLNKADNDNFIYMKIG